MTSAAQSCAARFQCAIYTIWTSTDHFFGFFVLGRRRIVIRDQSFVVLVSGEGRLHDELSQGGIVVEGRAARHDDGPFRPQIDGPTDQMLLICQDRRVLCYRIGLGTLQL